MAAMSKTSNQRTPKRRRGRAADVLSPRDLPPEIRRVIFSLICYGRCTATYIYGALGLERFGIKLDTFERYLRPLREASHSPGDPENRPEVLGEIIARWLLAGLSENAATMALRHARRLLGLPNGGRKR